MGVSLRDIANRRRHHGLLRHHFGSKEDIWRAVIDVTIADYLTALAPLLADAAQQGSTPVATLQAGARLLIRTATRQPDVTRLLMHEGIVGGPRLAYFMDPLRRSAPGWRRVFRPCSATAVCPIHGRYLSARTADARYGPVCLDGFLQRALQFRPAHRRPGRATRRPGACHILP